MLRHGNEVSGQHKSGEEVADKRSAEEFADHNIERAQQSQLLKDGLPAHALLHKRERSRCGREYEQECQQHDGQLIERILAEVPRDLCA